MGSEMCIRDRDISDLHRILKTVVELSFRTTKIKSLGLNRTYRVEMWEGWKQTSKARVSVQVKKYDPEVFPLYSSYTGGQGKELQVDDRQNILKNPKLWLFAAILLGGGAFSLWGVIHFFNREVAPTTSVMNNSQPSAPAPGAPGLAAKPAPAGPTYSSAWRIAGHVVADGVRQVVLIGPDGVIRYEHPSNFHNSGRVMVGDLDGQRVSTFSGAASAPRSPVPLPVPGTAP